MHVYVYVCVLFFVIYLTNFCGFYIRHMLPIVTHIAYASATQLSGTDKERA